MDTLTRNNYARLFDGILKNISYASSSKQVGAVFDRTYMPALILEDGKQIYHSFLIGQGATQVIPLPQKYLSSNRLYVSVEANYKAKITWNSPTHGSGQAVLLQATGGTTDGVHKALWCYQGDVSTMSVVIPITAQGGVTTEVKVFMYELPNLEIAASYFDKQIGLGVT